MGVFDKLKDTKLDDSQKGLLKMLGIIVGVLVLLIVILLMVKGCSGGTVSNDKLKSVMKNAAKKYVEKEPDALPNDIYGEYKLTAEKLSEKGYMKDMTKYKGKNTSCKGYVMVYYNNGNYSYSSRLENCDDDAYVSLKDELLNEKNIVTKNDGIYANDETGEYIYKGEIVNNYVKFANLTWRIVKVDANGNIELVQTKSIGSGFWDNRYNIDINKNDGINKFEATGDSRIKNTLISYYNKTDIFTSDVKSIIIPTSYCVGSRTKDDTSRDYSAECEVQSELLGVGSLLAIDVMNASLDENCTTTFATSCKNYNYLADVGTFWTLTPDPTTSYNAYFSKKGEIQSAKTSTSRAIYATIYINGDVEFAGGTGSITDPYTIVEES